MWISDFAIKRPVVTITAMLALVIFGLVSLSRLSTDEFPDVTPPVVVTQIAYPGASPDVVEKEVIDRIEEAISGISGVKKVRSTASDGYAVITTEFVFEKPLAECVQEIRDKISEIRSDLPQEMEEPVLSKFSDTDLPILSLAISSKVLDARQLTRLVDPDITRELRSVTGVAQVAVVGGITRELTVQLDPRSLERAGIGVAQVVQALQGQNLAVPVGRLNGEYDERSIRLRGRLEEPEDFMRIAVAERNGRLIRLGELGRAIDGVKEARTLASYNGKSAIGLEIRKSKGYATTQVADIVKKRLVAIKAKLPPGVELDVVRDAGRRANNSVTNVKETMLEGAALTVLVVLVFLNSWRSTVITGLALPVSVLASFIAVFAFGFTLNTMSLLGLSLAIGILVDDAIVVRENIVRHVEMGKDHYTAAREGTAEIGLAVAATTFSIVCVFVPIGFTSGISGQWFKPFALTIACSVLVSLFVSFSLDPMLSAYWADPHVPPEQRTWFVRLLDRFNDWFNHRADDYKGVIAWALDHRYWMVAMAAFSFVGAIVLQVLFGGGGFVPEGDNAEALIVVETPPGSNIEYTRGKVEEAAALARKHDIVRYTYATVGQASGAVDVGQVYVKTTLKTERKIGIYDFVAQLRRELATIGGARVYITGNTFGGGRKPLQIDIRGRDIALLQQTADTLGVIARGVPGMVDVGFSNKGARPEVNIDIDRAQAGALGITAGTVANALRPAFAGVKAGDWIDPSGETREVRVRFAPEARDKLSDLERLPLVLGGNAGAPTVVPLGSVARVQQGRGPAQIDHLQRDKVITLQANTEGLSLNEVTTGFKDRIRGVVLPPGVRVDFGGDVEQQQEVFTNILLALGAAVMLMYLILVVQFGSFTDPLAILVSLPLSLIGVVLMLLATGDTLNIMSMIGVILLMGIVAKNAILLIDFAKWQHEKGTPLREALIEAGRTRLRPIMMTTFALVAGMIPVALGNGEGADFRAPLGRAVIGGVITSTLLTLLVIPTFYEIIVESREWMGRRLRRLFGGAAMPAPAHAGAGLPPAPGGE